MYSKHEFAIVGLGSYSKGRSGRQQGCEPVVKPDSIWEWQLKPLVGVLLQIFIHSVLFHALARILYSPSVCSVVPCILSMLAFCLLAFCPCLQFVCLHSVHACICLLAFCLGLHSIYDCILSMQYLIRGKTRGGSAMYFWLNQWGSMKTWGLRGTRGVKPLTNRALCLYLHSVCFTFCLFYCSMLAFQLCLHCTRAPRAVCNRLNMFIKKCLHFMCSKLHFMFVFGFTSYLCLAFCLFQFNVHCMFESQKSLAEKLKNGMQN